jgi:hypothetical protein
MIGPRVVVNTDPPTVLISPEDSTPGLNYPILAGIGTIRRPIDGSENANCTVTLDNSNGGASALFALPPLRSTAIIYGPDSSIWFEGFVTQVTLDASASLLIEA